MQFKKGMGIENQQSIQTSYVAMLVGIKKYGKSWKWSSRFVIEQRLTLEHLLSHSYCNWFIMDDVINALNKVSFYNKIANLWVLSSTCFHSFWSPTCLHSLWLAIPFLKSSSVEIQ